MGVGNASGRNEVPQDLRRHLLVRAMLGEKVERVPVWAMRQAGRWDPEFRRLRGDLSFYEFSENAELSAAASLCPRRFGVDAIILFYDITTLSVAMGQAFDLVADRGPVPRRPIRTLADVDALTADPDESTYRHVTEILRIVRQTLLDELPVLVFAGAPFTLATYQIGTGKDLKRTRQFIQDQPQVWRALLEKTSKATVTFLQSLLDQGAAAYQLFDSWAGALTREEYSAQAHPFHEQIFAATKGLSILFVKDAPYVDLQVASGAGVVSLGKESDLGRLKRQFPQTVFQGNVDHEQLIDGSPESVQTLTRECLTAGGGHRHILNLDHGMDRQAKVENFVAFVEAARNR